MGEFTMPSLGADMDEGTIIEWLVGPGDEVHRGEIVAVVDTDKADVEVEVFENGVIEELLVEPGIRVPVGTPLARIGSGVPAGVAVRRPEVSPPSPLVREPVGVGARSTPTVTAAFPPPSSPVGFVRSSPLVRWRAAREAKLLASIRGSGPGGAVVARDLDHPVVVTVPPPAPAPAPAPAAPPAPIVETPAPRPPNTDAMRQAIAKLMERSKREIPHYYLRHTCELGAFTAHLERLNAERPLSRRILPAAAFLRAVALAARRHPDMNGFWHDAFEPSEHVHLGVAISLRGGGLLAPAILDADQCSLDELMERLQDLVQRARSGRLRGSEMSSPTLTVTNLGEQGVDEVAGVIYPPQVALVGIGRVVERPRAVDGLIGVRPTTVLSLAADHRASDGHSGARFLRTIDQLLQRPEEL